MMPEEKTCPTCPACVDGIPAHGPTPGACPRCGRRVLEGMALQRGRSGQLVWDYPAPACDVRANRDKGERQN